MHCCKKCMGFIGILAIVSGLMFLLRDLNIWNFWNIQTGTVIILLAGFGLFFSSGCTECNPEIKTTKNKKK